MDPKTEFYKKMGYTKYGSEETLIAYPCEYSQK